MNSVAVSMHASQACDPGSSPGSRSYIFCVFVPQPLCLLFLCLWFFSPSTYPNIVPALHQVQPNHTNTVCPVVPKLQNCISSEETPYKHTWQVFNFFFFFADDFAPGL